MLTTFNRGSVKILGNCVLCQTPAIIVVNSYNYDHATPALEVALCSEHSKNVLVSGDAVAEVRKYLGHEGDI
jgi:hypothetical protein